MTTHLDSLTPAQLAAIRARLATRTEPTVAQIQKAQAVDDEWRRQGWSVAQGLARVLAALDEAERERDAYRALLMRVSEAWDGLAITAGTAEMDAGALAADREHDAAHEAIKAALAAKDCPDAP